MNSKYLYIACIVCLIVSGCKEPSHLITDKKVRKQTERDFTIKKAELPHGELFSIFEKPMTEIEKEAMKFLYAYMPLGDIADYTGEFYLENIRYTLLAKEEMPWGEIIPEDIFHHFVLPIRVNNENLDESRKVFYEEIKERIKGLSMHDAVLEINHWCHEKVTYMPSDRRTSSPLASIKTAYGRCGEESVLAVAAMRSVGIPARQVYTPRWAHTDSNHAWIEVWVDGKWYFMGACEPEPVLNLGWFNGPASRGMLMHCKVFGKYNGPEEIMDRTDCYTEINVTDIYAPTAKSVITVINPKGQPVPDATVEFKVYNYAEFYTVARKKSDPKGQCELKAGKGDMLVWASKDGMYGFSKLTFGKDDQLTITLDHKPGDPIELDIDIVPPTATSASIEVTEEQKTENAKRVQKEDSIRNAYMKTFYTHKQARKLAREIKMDHESIISIMTGSKGNWPEIEKFIKGTQQSPHKAKLMLHLISAKDLRDTPADVLFDHFNNTYEITKADKFLEEVLNPRVSDELLTPYRSILQQAFKNEFQEYPGNPQKIVSWVRNHIHIKNNLNPQRIPVSPIGVLKSMTADKHSRDVFLVALARSMNIPARIETVTRKVQYNQNGDWIDVNFDSPDETLSEKGMLEITYQPTKTFKDPAYNSHFTIAKVNNDGTLQTLDFSARSRGIVGKDTWSYLFSKPVELEAGNYILVSGTRMAKGNVLSRITSFTVIPGKLTTTKLQMRENEEDIQVIGSVDAEAKFQSAKNSRKVSILETTGRGYFIIGIVNPNQEPSVHALKDLATVDKELEKWNRNIILLFQNKTEWRNFTPDKYGELPENITYGIDADRNISNMIKQAMESNSDNLPLFIIADTFGRVVFYSQGYTIGLGEQIVKVIGKL